MFSQLSKLLFQFGLNLALLGMIPAGGAMSQAVAQSPSRIAGLQTDTQVLEFIRPLGWEYAAAVLGDSAVAAYQPYRSTKFAVNGAQTWIKADFDHNGRPDLLVLARRGDNPFVFCLLDLGTELRVVRNFYSATLRRQPAARVVQRNGQDILEYADFARRRGPKGQLQNRRTQLLAYVAGGFVEFNPNPERHQLQQLTYEAHAVYHQAIQTRITVAQDSITFWERRTEVLDSTQVSQLVSRRRLLPTQRQELVELLNYLGVSTLRNSYGAEAFSHHARVTLMVEYGDGQRKEVEDINGTGTVGLRRLYVLLNELANP